MSKQDGVTKAYMSNPATFADMFNAYLYEGRRVIDSTQLEELDPTEIADLMKLTIDKAEMDPLQKHRDVLKRMCVMTDQKNTYVLLGIENQTHIDRTMPVRVMLYDAIRYLQQFKDIASKNKHDKKPGIDHLSGVATDDTICPIITLVINFDSKKWNQPTTLHELFEDDSQIRNLLRFVPNFQMNLFDPHALNKEDFDVFQTALKQIFKYIKFSSDKNALKQIVHEDPAYTDMDVSSAKVIDVITGSNLRNLPKEGKVNMCKAIEEMIKEGKLEEKKEIALNMLNAGMEVELITQVTGLSPEEVLNLKNNA